MPPHRPRRYRLISLLGEGGSGRVYRARAEGGAEPTRELAIKLLHARSVSPAAMERFRDEGRILELITDRAVVRVEAPVRLGGRWALVMEYAEGVALERLVRRGPLPSKVALEIAAELARALDAVWTQPGPEGAPLHLLHRDLKPGNVQIGPDGRVRILDMGSARADFADRQSKTTRHLGGTPGYIAPERLEGREGPEGDLYALGVLLHELLTGARPEPGAWATDAGSAQGSDALALSVRLRDPRPEGRPTAREAARIAGQLAAGQPGPGLVVWAEEEVPPEGLVVRDALVGTVLVEDASPGRRPRPALWWLALPMALALSAPWWPAGVPPVYEARQLTTSEVGGVRAAALLAGGGLAWVDASGLWRREGAAVWAVPLPEGLQADQVVDDARGGLIVGGVRDGQRALWRLPAEGSPRPLGAWEQQQVAVGPGGDALALVTEDGLYTLEDGSRPRRVMALGPLVHRGQPAWSPDGRSIALATWEQAGERRRARILLADLDEGSTRPLVEDEALVGSGGQVSPVAWTPGGALLYTLLEGDGLALWRLPLGREPVRVQSLRGRSAAALLVRGQELAALVGGGDEAVFTVDLRGAGPLVPLHSEGAAGHPTGWLPDGRLLIHEDGGALALAEGAPAERMAAGEAVPAGAALLVQEPRTDGRWLVLRQGDQERPLSLIPPEERWAVRCAQARCAVQRVGPTGTTWSTMDLTDGVVEAPFHARTLGGWPDFDLAPDGAAIYLVEGTGRVDRVEVATGHRRALPRAVRGRRAEAVAALPDGEHLALAGRDAAGRPLLWLSDLQGEVLVSLPLTAPAAHLVAGPARVGLSLVTVDWELWGWGVEE